MIQRGIAVVTFNRANRLEKLLKQVCKTAPKDCRIVLCDDGSTDETPDIAKNSNGILYVRGPNLGVGANKNRALWALQDCHFLAIIEDDLFPMEGGWFDIYEQVCQTVGIHHFCRVQDKEVPEVIPEFSTWLKEYGLTPVYGSSPRGDLTFISNQVLRKVGAFNPEFKGAGYAHGEWSARVAKAGLIPHPTKWIDIKEARDKFVQEGDVEGGRWVQPPRKIKEQIKANHHLMRKLKLSNYIYHPLVFS